MGMARLAGATDVVNKVEPSEAAKERAAANLTKGGRRAQIKKSETVARSERHSISSIHDFAPNNSAGRRDGYDIMSG